jgi:transposase-like protein
MTEKKNTVECRTSAYPPEFREQTVREWLKGGRSLASVAREAGVNFETFRLWRRKYGPALAKEMGLPESRVQPVGPQVQTVAASSILTRLAALEVAVAALRKAVGA